MRGDQVDQAEAIERQARDRMVAAVSARAAELDRPGEAAPCVDCDEEIEPERRAAAPGARRCVECQGALERRRRGLR